MRSWNLPHITALDGDDNETVNGLLKQLDAVRHHNSLVANYYDCKARVQDMGIAIPPHLRGLIEAVVGWPGTVVDVLEERIDHNGWVVPGTTRDYGINELVTINQLDVEFSKGHLDALIYGIAFGVVGRGTEPDDPEVLITIEPATRMTGHWNRRRRALDFALCVTTTDDGKINGLAFYKPGKLIDLALDGNTWVVEQEYTYKMDGLPVEPIINRPRAGDTGGRSEITRAIRYYTDNAVRTVLGMEVAREFFSAPQRYLMGARQSDFVDDKGNPIDAWESYLGRILAIGQLEDGTLPQAGTFTASSPEPYLAQLRGMAQLIAAEAGMSVTYLGIIQDNPASADAIRAADVRLEKRAERRQRIFGAAEGRLMRKALWVRDERDPGVMPVPIWRDAGTPTRSAQAQDAVALVHANILPPDSDVTYERIGMSDADRQRVRADLRRSRLSRTLSALEAVTGRNRAEDSTDE